MAKITFVWEMGNGMGHVARMLPIAHELALNNHHIHFIVREREKIDEYLFHTDAFTPESIALIPHFKHQKISFSRKPANYSEVLLLSGFHDVGLIQEKYEWWKTTLRSLSPDIIFFDSAPHALLAAKTLNTKRIILGDPFSHPSDMFPSALFPTEQKIPISAVKPSDEVLINNIRKATNDKALNKVSDIYSADKVYLFSYEELDYHALYRQDKPSYLEINQKPLTSFKKIKWENEAKKRIFVYLKMGYPQLTSFISCINTLSKIHHWHTIIYLNGANEDAVTTFETDNLTLSLDAYDTQTALCDADLVVCHAGHNLVMESMSNAVPLLLIPLQQEQFITTQQCIFNSFCVGLNPQIHDEKEIKLSIEKAISSTKIRNSLEHFRAKKNAQGLLNNVATIVNDVEVLLRMNK